MNKKMQDEIAKVAYELYEKRGGGHGCDFDDWVEAEKIVRARFAKADSPDASRRARSTTRKAAAPAAAVSPAGTKKATRKKKGEA